MNSERMDDTPICVDGLLIYRMQLPNVFGTRYIYVKEEKYGSD